MAGNTSVPGASVTSRAFALLGAFDTEHRQLTLSDLARRTGLSLTTAHRLIAELVQWRALRRTSDGEYIIGRRLWEVGLLAPVQSDLRQIASPFLHDVYGATLATVHLAIREGHHVLYVDRLSGTASVPVVSQVGSQLPLHATGVGKVLLAYAPEEVQLSVLGSLERITAYTVTQPGRLREELRRVHDLGFAQTVEEMSLGACSAAVPIRRANGPVVAALGIVVPNLKRDRPRQIAALQVAAQGIGRSLS